MAVIRVSSVIRRNERRLNSEPYVCSTTFGRATLGASDVRKKLFLAFLFRDPDVGVLLEDVGLVRSSMVCCKCGFQMSLCVDTNRKDGCRWQCRRITTASVCFASASIRHGSWFQQRTAWRFCSSPTTSFAPTNAIERTWRHVKAFLNPCNRMGSYIYHLAHYMFAVGNRPVNVDQFTKFIGLVTTMDCTATTPHHRRHVAM